jgi:hypothetical protein
LASARALAKAASTSASLLAFLPGDAGLGVVADRPAAPGVVATGGGRRARGVGRLGAGDAARSRDDDEAGGGPGECFIAAPISRDHRPTRAGVGRGAGLDS